MAKTFHQILLEINSPCSCCNHLGNGPNFQAAFRQDGLLQHSIHHPSGNQYLKNPLASYCESLLQPPKSEAVLSFLLKSISQGVPNMFTQ